MLTALDSRVSDANAEALGMKVRDLMGEAGRSVSGFLKGRFPDASVVFVCGSGNNGGDGYATAMNLDPERTCVALLCEPSRIHSDESRFYYSLLECPIVRYEPGMLSRYDVVVDCALGTGSSGRAKGDYATFIEETRSCANVVSVDVPSGLGTELSVRPVATVTFMDVKEGMTPENSGEIVVADIGIPEDAYRVVGPGDMLRYPVPGRDSHKGQNGRLMVIAGGPYFGAPVMSCLSALRTGADIVRLFAPESIHLQASLSTPVLMITDLPGDRLTVDSVEMLLRESESYDAVLIGPGVGTDPGTVEAVRSFVSRCGRPMVVDADGLTAIAGMRLNGNAVLTPHHGEFARLGGGDPEDVARAMGATVLLKGAEDVISDGSRTRVNRTGTPAMTGAGTGDVLAGCVSALLSKGMSAFDSACLGAYICGTAGERAFADRSYGLIATDVIDEIPTVLREHLR